MILIGTIEHNRSLSVIVLACDRDRTVYTVYIPYTPGGLRSVVCTTFFFFWKSLLKTLGVILMYPYSGTDTDSFGRYTKYNNDINMPESTRTRALEILNQQAEQQSTAVYSCAKRTLNQSTCKACFRMCN